MINLRQAAGAFLTATLLSLVSIPAQAHTQNGVASFYSDYYNGRRMANGQLFYNSSNSCAHRTLRFGTVVTVKNTSNGKTTRCVVRDRGPYVSGRVIDLSRSSFSNIASPSRGVVRVVISW